MSTTTPASPSRSPRSIPPTSKAIAASSIIRPASIAKAMRSSAPSRSSISRSMLQAAPAARPLPGLALGLFDRLGLRPQREAAPGPVLPHPAGRRQSDDDERDLRADPQAGARRRRLVRARRHQCAGRGMVAPFRAARRRRSGSAIRSSRSRPSGGRATGGPDPERLERPVRRRRLQCRRRPHLRHAGGHKRGARGRRQAAPQALLAIAVRRPFRLPRRHGRTFRTTRILFGPRYEELLGDIYRGEHAARRSVALPPPSDRDRSGDGAAGQIDLLRARAGPASRQARRSTGTTEGPAYARAHPRDPRGAG